MSTFSSFEELMDIIPPEVTETDEEGTPIEESENRYTKSVSYTIGYLLGVRDDFLDQIDSSKEAQELKDTLNKNVDALIVRTLNNIRTNLMLGFKQVSRTASQYSANFTAIYDQSAFKEDFKILHRYDVHIEANRSDANDYIANANKEIEKRLIFLKPLFPDWVEFKYIDNMFRMPANIQNSSKAFQVNQNCYPYKRYFNWSNPSLNGNILVNDLKILSIIYEDNGDSFQLFEKVRGASKIVFEGISEFLSNGCKIQAFIDGENISPYKFQAMIASLTDDELDKIEKIVVICDMQFSVNAWDYLEDFSYEVPVEVVKVERLIENKSLVDHTLVARISKSIYKDNVDSIILASSDSDFWSVIRDFSEANFLVMVEENQCSYNFKDALWSSNVFYCYLDRFKMPKGDEYFKFVFAENLYNELKENAFKKPFKQLFDTVLYSTYRELSAPEIDALYKKYLNGISFTYDKDGYLQVNMPQSK